MIFSLLNDAFDQVLKEIEQDLAGFKCGLAHFFCTSYSSEFRPQFPYFFLSYFYIFILGQLRLELIAQLRFMHLV